MGREMLDPVAGEAFTQDWSGHERTVLRELRDGGSDRRAD
jgi:hypothetical protein